MKLLLDYGWGFIPRVSYPSTPPSPHHHIIIGKKNLPEKWWHFTLQEDRIRGLFFDFDSE